MNPENNRVKIKIGLLLGLLLALAFVLGIDSQPIKASTPTPSPTLQTIRPTATSIYLYLRPTPTLLNVPIAPTLDLHLDPTLQADLIVNLYRWANRDHLFDFIGTAALVLIVVGLIIRMVTRNSNPS